MYVIAALLLFCTHNYLKPEPIDFDQSSGIKKEKKILEGDVFLVPNVPSKAKEFCEGCCIYGRWNVRSKDSDSKMPVAKDDYCMEIWMTSKDEEDVLTAIQEQENRGVSCNWADHGHPVVGSYVRMNYLPYELLKDKKEGDIVEFDYHHPGTGKVFGMRLTCRQLAYRYRECGDFQTCLENMLKRAAYWEAWLQKEESEAKEAKPEPSDSTATTESAS